MCAACVEYTKEKLNLNELKSALKETTQQDPGHLKEVSDLIHQFGNDPKELGKELRKKLDEIK